MHFLPCLFAVSAFAAVSSDREEGLSFSVVVEDPVSAYSRPDSASTVFAGLYPGDTLTVSVMSPSGWMGFDPGVAQAGNSGSFRFRWVSPGARVILLGDPEVLPVIWAPEAGTVYAMIFIDTPLFMSPDSVSCTADTLAAGSAAAVEMRDDCWLLVNPARGPAGTGSQGWVRLADVSISGDMDSVPLREISTGL